MTPALLKSMSIRPPNDVVRDPLPRIGAGDVGLDPVFAERVGRLFDVADDYRRADPAARPMLWLSSGMMVTFPRPIIVPRT